MKTSVLSAIMVCAAAVAVANVLENSGFEADVGEEDWSTRWGNFGIESWNNPPVGHLAAFIKGKWGGGALNGGCIQSVPVTAGIEYELKGRFYLDNGWTAETKALKLEFFDQDGVLVRTYADDLTELKDKQWVEIVLRGKAPDDAVRAQVVLEAAGIGEDGVLGADAIELMELSAKR